MYSRFVSPVQLSRASWVVLSHSVSGSNISRNCFCESFSHFFFLSFFLFFLPLQNGQQLCSSNHRISLVREAVCHVLGASSGLPVLPILSFAGGSSTQKIPSTRVEGLPRRVCSIVLASNDRFQPHMVVRCPASDGRHFYVSPQPDYSLSIRCVGSRLGVHTFSTNLSQVISLAWNTYHRSTSESFEP